MSEFRRAPAAGKIRKGVVGVRRALVRQGRRLDSPIVCSLVCGTRVLCTDLATEKRQKKRRSQEFVTRVHIVSPLTGWCSAKTLQFDDEPTVIHLAPGMTCVAALVGEQQKSIQDETEKRTEDDLLLPARTLASETRVLTASPNGFSRSNKSRSSAERREQPQPLEVIKLHDANFEAATRATEGDSGDWLVFIVAPWCSYCKQVDSLLQNLRVDLANESSCCVRISMLDVTESPGVARRFGVRAVPTIIFLHWGSVYEFRGHRTSKALVEFVRSGFEDTLGFAVPKPELSQVPSDLNAGEESSFASIIPVDARAKEAVVDEGESVKKRSSEKTRETDGGSSNDVVALGDHVSAVIKMQAVARRYMSRDR